MNHLLNFNNNLMNNIIKKLNSINLHIIKIKICFENVRNLN